MDNINHNGQVISSDLQYVIDNMNDLRTQVKNHSSLSKYNNMNFKNNDSVYGNMNNLVKSYFESTSELMKIIDKEALSVINIAKSYEKLDEDLSEKAGGV